MACCVIARHGDRIAADHACHIGHPVEVAEDRNPIDNWSGQLLGRQAETDHFHSPVRLLLDPHSELLSRRRTSNHDDMPEALTMFLLPMQEFSGTDTNDQAGNDPNRCADHNHAEYRKKRRCDCEART